MNATAQLREEHKGILIMLKILEHIATQMASGKEANLEHLKQIVEFLTVFADQCHHGKEEDILFPALEKAGIPKEGGPIGVMLSEHDHGRADIRAMRKALEDLEAGRDEKMNFVRPANDYIALLRSHISKEDGILFVMAERSLKPEDQKNLFDAFEVMEREKIGEGRHEAFHKLMDDLRKIYNV